MQQVSSLPVWKPNRHLRIQRNKKAFFLRRPAASLFIIVVLCLVMQAGVSNQAHPRITACVSERAAMKQEEVRCDSLSCFSCFTATTSDLQWNQRCGWNFSRCQQFSDPSLCPFARDFSRIPKSYSLGTMLATHECQRVCQALRNGRMRADFSLASTRITQITHVCLPGITCLLAAPKSTPLFVSRVLQRDVFLSGFCHLRAHDGAMCVSDRTTLHKS